MIDEFKELIELENCMEGFFQNYQNRREIILFGAGFSMRTLIEKLLRENINIVCICDNDIDKQGKEVFNSLKILSFEESKKLYPDALYIISSHNYFWEIYNNLLKHLPLEQVCNIDFQCAHYFYGFTFKKYFLNNISGFENVYNLFYDKFSKELFIQILRAHFTGERKEFDKAYGGDDDWYLFKTLLKPNSHSIYLDCGAYDGDTILLFHKAATNGYDKIIALEPDPNIYSNLTMLIDSHHIKNVEIIKVGAYNKKSIVSFEQDGVYSNITKTDIKSSNNKKVINIQVDKIDNIVENMPIDIIKMDIEGAEYYALQGAEKAIIKYKPKLAICLYHNYEDFLRIPLLINEMQEGYRFYLRHQSFGCTDTILFAVSND